MLSFCITFKANPILFKMYCSLQRTKCNIQLLKKYTFADTMSRNLFIWILILVAKNIPAQICTLPGQTPATAFPICGNGTFNQPNLSACRNDAIYVPGCTDQRTSYGDNNPFYYKFSCNTSGSFAFTITPISMNENYDWQLFDITGHNPIDIFRDKTLIISGSWSGSTGPTGASASGVNFIQCRSDPFFEQKPTFASMPLLQAGHNYILLVAHTDDILSGYSLSIGGGTADITSNTIQEIKAEAATCDNRQMMILFSKKIKCSSIAADGSDFNLSPASASIVNVTGINCNNSFNTDSIVFTFNNPLPVGSYTMFIKNGTDGNTLLDNCNNSLNNNTQVSFQVFPFAALDSIIPVSCLPDKLVLTFKKSIRCNSVATDGSDFIITGPGSVLISNASMICNNNAVTNQVEIKLQQPITNPGNYILTLKNGTDGNTITDACNEVTPVGESINFTIKDTVNADFTITIKEGCIADTVLFFNEGKIGVTRWYWSLDNNISLQQSPSVLYTSGGFKLAELIVSNGLCSDTVQNVFAIKQKLVVDFIAPLTSCPEASVVFKDNSSNAVNWFWNFSNGNTSNLQNPPPQQYPNTGSEKEYNVMLTVQNGNCIETTNKKITVKASCIIAVPTAFTPNNDGLNDFLGPLNTGAVSNIQFTVFNRYGQPVFKSSEINSKWNGTINNIKQPAGVYVWLLKYTDPVSGKIILQKGSTLLFR